LASYQAIGGKKLRCSEEQVQAMKDRGDCLEQVELFMTIEEIPEDLK
jgi:hypothetical protein